MAQITNLNRFRKQKARADKRAAGDANAAKFGEGKPLRDARRAEQDRADRTHDGHKRDD